jgi:hypothetical protein
VEEEEEALGVEAPAFEAAAAPEAVGSGLVVERVPVGGPVVLSAVVQPWVEPAAVG